MVPWLKYTSEAPSDCCPSGRVKKPVTWEIHMLGAIFWSQGEYENETPLPSGANTSLAGFQ